MQRKSPAKKVEPVVLPVKRDVIQRDISQIEDKECRKELTKLLARAAEIKTIVDELTLELEGDEKKGVTECIKNDIKELMKYLHITTLTAPVTGGKLVVPLVSGVSKTLSKESLLSNGVPVEKIEASYKVKNWESVQIRIEKDK